MTKVNDEQSGRDGDKADPGSSERMVDRRLDLPRSFRDKGIHEVWGSSGPANLLRRLAQENELGRSAPRPLGNDELAQLVELYDDEPLPQALKSILVRELRNERRVRPGRKADLSPPHKLKQLLLPALYERGTLVARRYRRRLLLIEKRKKRWQLAEQIPTEAEVALRYVRKWLPLSDKTLANRLTALKDKSERKKRKRRAVER